MKLKQRQFVSAFLIDFGAVAAIALVSSIPFLEMIGATLLPGALIAALIFPQGIHSDHGSAFLVLSAILDGMIFGFVALLILWRRSRSAAH